MFNDNPELIYNEPYIAFLILLSLSDMNKQMESLTYYFVTNTLKSFRDNLPRSYISIKEPLSIEIQNFYLDLLSNVMRIIVKNGIRIKEENLEEMIVDNFIFFLKKARYE